MTRSQFFATAALVLVIGSAALGQTSTKARTFTGTYTCIACDLKKTLGTHSQCSVYGHDYGIKLTNGRYVHFLPNDHSEALVKGGGRTDYSITVTGVYDRNAHTIDVQKYVIDGITTVWSPEHQKMEMAPTHKQLLSTESKEHQLTEK